MAKLQQPPCCHLVITRDGGGITADHVLRQGVHLNAAFIQVAFDLVPIRRLAQVGQQMAQPVVTEIQRLDDLSGQVAQGVLHALDEDVSEVLVCYSLGVYETQSNPQANRVIA